MAGFPCPYLNADVELTDERDRHIANRHPDLLPEHHDRVADALADPDAILRDADYPSTRLFCRWFEDLIGGENVVVAVVSEPSPSVRHWIVTAYISRKLPNGDLEWKRL